MRISRDEKRKRVSEFFNQIMECTTESDIDRLCDKLDDLVVAGYLSKKDSDFLGEELDCQLMNIIEKQFKD